MHPAAALDSEGAVTGFPCCSAWTNSPKLNLSGLTINHQPHVNLNDEIWECKDNIA
jgi:hypothetical protein